MKTLSIATLILLFIVTVCSAQKPDTSYINALNEKAWLLKDSAKTEAKEHAFEALELSKKINYKKGESDSYSRLGVIYKNEAKYDSALFYHKKAALIRIAFPDKSELASTYNNLGNIYKNIDLYDSAIVYFTKSLEIKNSIGSPNEAIKANINLGQTLELIGQFEQAIAYYLDALNTATDEKDIENIADVNTNIANAYLASGKHQTALDLYLKNLDFYKENDLQAYSGLLGNIGVCYLKAEDYNLSEKYFSESLQLNLQLNIPKDIAEAYTNLSTLHLAKRNFTQAVLFGKKAFDLSDEINAHSVSISNLGNLSIAYSALNKFDSAYYFISLLNELNDSIFLNQQKTKIALGLEAKYQNVKQKQENIIANQQLKTKSLHSRIYFIIASSLLVILFIGSIIYIQQRRLNRKKAQLANQQINELLNTQEIKSLNAMMEGQETERKRIAQDLHDRIGSLLSTVKLHFNSLEGKVEIYQTENKEQFSKLNILLDEAVGEVRQISHNLVSGVLLQFGLEAALRELCENIQDAGHVKIDFITHGIDERLNNQTEISLYRIVQELLSNILKHAHATEVTIQITRHDHEITILVEDNGKGFDTTKNYEGIGLKNIRNRVEKINGTFTIDSAISKGTTSIINLFIDFNS